MSMISKTKPKSLECFFKDFGLMQMSLDAKVEKSLDKGESITEPLKVEYNGFELIIRPVIKKT